MSSTLWKAKIIILCIFFHYNNKEELLDIEVYYYLKKVKGRGRDNEPEKRTIVIPVGFHLVRDPDFNPVNLAYQHIQIQEGGDVQ